MTGIILYCVMILNGAFEYRSGNPSFLFPWQTAVQDTSCPVLTASPALLPFTGGPLFNAGASRPYSGGEIGTGSVALQYGPAEYGLQGSWNSFGSDFYREHTLSAMAGYAVFPFLSAGISENLYILKIQAEGLSLDKSFADSGFALLLNISPWFKAGLIQTNIFSMLNGKNADIIYPERSAGILLKPCRGFSLCWNITETAVERVNAFTAAVNPAPFFSVSGGYCRENSSLAASFTVSASGFFVSYGLRYHPYLGYSHSLGITCAPDRSVETLDYSRPLFRSSRKRINVKTASIEDFKEIEGLTPRSAERIVLYREKIGPVNEKALVQIGMTGDEIKSFESGVYGLERSVQKTGSEKLKGKVFKKYVKKPPRRERIKTKFRSLIGGGIRANTAILYSELSETADTEGFNRRLNSDGSLTAEQKKFIGKICSARP